MLTFSFLSSQLIPPLHVSLQCGGISICAAIFESQGVKKSSFFVVVDDKFVVFDDVQPLRTSTNLSSST